MKIIIALFFVSYSVFPEGLIVFDHARDFQPQKTPERGQLSLSQSQIRKELGLAEESSQWAIFGTPSGGLTILPHVNGLNPTKRDSKKWSIFSSLEDIVEKNGFIKLWMNELSKYLSLNEYFKQKDIEIFQGLESVDSKQLHPQSKKPTIWVAGGSEKKSQQEDEHEADGEGKKSQKNSVPEDDFGLVRLSESCQAKHPSPPHLKYDNNGKFLEAMTRAASSVPKVLEIQKEVNQETIKKILDNIMKVRAPFGGQAGDSYGVKIPTTVKETEEVLKQFKVDPKIEFERPGVTMDYSYEDGIYSKYYHKIKELAKRNTHMKMCDQIDRFIAHFHKSKQPFSSRPDLQIPQSTFKHFECQGCMNCDERCVVAHPSWSEMVKIRERAYKILEEATNEILQKKSISQDALNNLAKAFALFCHATPWVNGSPTVFEVYISGLLQVAGYALPPVKIEEPFWQIILADKDVNEITWSDFISCYKKDSEQEEKTNPSAATSAASS